MQSPSTSFDWRIPTENGAARSTSPLNSTFELVGENVFRKREIQNDLNNQLDDFISNILELPIKEKEFNVIFNQLEMIVRTFSAFCTKLIPQFYKDNPLDAIRITEELMTAKLEKVKTNYKREKKYKGIISSQVFNKYY